MRGTLIELSDGTVYLARLEPRNASEPPLSDMEKVILDLHKQIEKIKEHGTNNKLHIFN